MRHVRPFVLLVVVLAIGLVGCATAKSATWTFPPAAPAGVAVAGAAVTAPSPAAPAPSAVAPAAAATSDQISIDAFDLGFKPAAVAVAAPGMYDVTFHNTGSTAHDLTFADGTKIAADAGQTSKGMVTVPAGGLTFLCSIPGHADAGMKGAVTVAGVAPAASSAAPAAAGTADAPVADPNAPKYALRDAKAPAVMTGTVHDIDMPMIEKDITVADGFVVHAWTFGGTVPGPTIRVHLGDTVNVHLTNTGTMSHSIDFHASQTAMNDQMVEIKPGATRWPPRRSRTRLR